MEILQNTIIKLVVLQGPDSDRKPVILTSGEPAFTTDLKRFYIGDGVTSGGVLVGNLYLGSSPDKTSFVPGVSGDIAYDTDKRSLYRVLSGDGSNHADWELIGGVYSSGDPRITISPNNTLTMNPLSSSHIDGDALSNPLYINSGRVSLRPLSAGYIDPDAVKGPIIVDAGQVTLSSKVPFQSVSTTTFQVLSSGLRSTVNGNNSTGIAVNPLSSNIVIESNQLYSVYNALSTSNVNFSKNITSSATLSAGHYRFSFDPLDTTNYIVTPQILGLDALAFQPRVIARTNTSCDVIVVNSSGGLTEANVSILISY